MCRPLRLSDWRSRHRGGFGHEGKIEGRGTRQGIRPGLHVGCGGTPPARRGAPGQVKGREAKGLGRASPDRVRWSWRNGRV